MKNELATIGNYSIMEAGDWKETLMAIKKKRAGSTIKIDRDVVTPHTLVSGIIDFECDPGDKVFYREHQLMTQRLLRIEKEPFIKRMKDGFGKLFNQDANEDFQAGTFEKKIYRFNWKPGEYQWVIGVVVNYFDLYFDPRFICKRRND